MKNPYALYNMDTPQERNEVKKAQRKITRIITEVVNRAKTGTLNQWVIEDAGKRIRKIKNIQEAGGLDTQSRECIWDKLLKRLEKEANMEDKKERESLGDKFWIAISDI